MNSSLFPVVEISSADVESKVLDYLDIQPTDSDYMVSLKSYLSDMDSVNHSDLVMLVLHLEGYDLRSIAAYVGVSHTTVNNHIHRMLSHFRGL